MAPQKRAHYPETQNSVNIDGNACERSLVKLVAVVSNNVAAVGYDSGSRTMRVQFQRGGVYDYFSVDSSLYAEMLKPHPWRRVGRIVKSHRYVQVG